MRKKAEIFKALGDETRLRIMHLLAASKKELCCCEITDSLQVPQYKVSKHLKALKMVGLVEDRRDGRWVYYSLVGAEGDPFLRDLFRTLSSLGSSIEAFGWDKDNLDKRLALRVKGKCVLGLHGLNQR